MAVAVMADGGWRMADGGWRMADGGWQSFSSPFSEFPLLRQEGPVFYSNRDVHDEGTFPYRFLPKSVMSHVESPFMYQNDGLKSDKNIKNFLRSGKEKHF
jgi:hypothetical protein